MRPHDQAPGRPEAGGDIGIPPSRLRLPAATRVGAVELQVADLGRSIDYYQTVIGLGVLSSAGHTATLGAPGSRRPLVRLDERSGARPVARRGLYGLYHFALLLPDRASLGRCARHLRQARISLGSADHLVSEALYLTDPDGLGIEIYADRPRDLWQRRGRELVMASAPLDWNGLTREGQGVPWTGVPEGTTIGHIHLHVGDLGLADAFYREGIGFDTIVWTYAGALFFSAGGYHHHLGTNTWASGPAAREDDAQLLGWELVVPTPSAMQATAASLRGAGYGVVEDAGRGRVRDPWGTRLDLVTETPAE